MNNKFDDILPNNSNSNPDGLKDLNDALNREEISSENEDNFEQDATEGLQQISKDNISVHVTTLNKSLNEALKNKKKNKRKIPDQTMVYLTIIILLLLLVMAYIVIKKGME